MQIPFHKYHGTGNDFVLVDNRGGLLTGDENKLFAAICARRFGVGADGLILLNPSSAHDFYMDYFNSDGNRSSMCGNGGRCIAAFALDLGVVSDSATFTAIDGLHHAEFTDHGVKLRMSKPQGYRPLSNGDHWIDTGSPHYVSFREEKVEDIDVFRAGRNIRNSEPWKAEGTNVNFVNQIDGETLDVRTYERGVEDETWSCGTGVTACAEVFLREKDQPEGIVSIRTRGGKLRVHVSSGQEPWLEGPTQFVFRGTWEYTS